MSYLNQSIKNVYISSKQRQVGESSNSITVRFNPSIDRCKGVQIITAEIPQTWYPFTYFNNQIAYVIDDGTNTIYYASLPTDKFYFNMTDLATDIKTALDNAVDSDNNTNSSITFSVSFTMSKMSFLYGLETGSESFQFVPTQNSAYSMVGLSNFAEGFIFSYQGTSIASLQRTLAVYILSDIVPPNGFSTIPGCERTLAKIPVDVDAGNIITYEDQSNSFTPLDSSYISQMKLTLVDDNGTIIDLNGSDWSCELSYFY